MTASGTFGYGLVLSKELIRFLRTLFMNGLYRSTSYAGYVVQYIIDTVKLCHRLNPSMDNFLFKGAQGV